MKKILLLVLIICILLAGLPHSAEAGRQVKTIGFFLGQYLNSSNALSTASSDIKSPQPVHFNNTIYLPEENINVENAWVEMGAVITNTTAVAVVNVSIKFNGTEVSPALLTAPNYYLSGVAEERPIYIFANVTNILRNFTDYTKYGPANVSIAINGPNSNQHNAVLWVTYSYNDNSTEQLNTVVYPIYTYNTTTAAGKTVTIPFRTIVPENNSIFSQWASLYGWTDCATSTDARVDATVNGSDFNKNQLYLTCGSTASYGWNYLLNLTGMNFTLNTNNTLYFNTTAQSFETLGGEIFVTYNYTATVTANPTLTKTVQYYLAQDPLGPSNANRTFSNVIYLPENSTNITEVWAHITAGWTSATAAAVDVNGTIGSTTVTKVKYQLNAPGASMSQNTIIYNMSEAKASLTNGTTVALGVTYNGATASSDTVSAVLFITYTYAANSGSQQKTAQYLLYNTPNTNNNTVMTFNLTLPDFYPVRLAAFTKTFAMANASVNFFNITSNTSNGYRSFWSKITFGNSGVGRTVSLLDNDSFVTIDGNGTLNLTLAATAPNIATAKAGAAFASKLYFTYISATDTQAPTASNVLVNASLKQNDWGNLSASWSDNNKLSSYWFSVNVSNTGVNSTTSIFPNVASSGFASNITKITANPGSIVYWYAHANDTSNNNGTSGVKSFTVNPGLRFNSTFGNNITGVAYGAFAVGDINNDSLLDFVEMGMNITNTTPYPITQVYINLGTKMVRNSSWDNNITPLGFGALALADFNRDGLLDLIETGANDSRTAGKQAYVYINNGTSFLQNDSWFKNLTAVTNGSIAVGDINNDGLLDVILSGNSAFNKTGGAETRVYLNNGTGFNSSNSYAKSLPNLNQSTVILADFNNDTFLDVLLAGSNGTLANQKNFTGIFLNNGTYFVYNLTESKNITASSSGGLAIADINNDGAMDFIQLAAQGPALTRTYLNNISGLQENNSWTVNVTPDYYGSAALADINNDGWVDLVTNGMNTNTTGFTDAEVYTSNWTGFAANVPFESEITSSAFGNVALADFANDSDVDLLISGLSTPKGGLNFTTLYTNDIHLNNTNTLPSPPTTFNSTSGGSNNITLYWGAGSDTETPKQGLYYNLRVGTCSLCNDIVSGVYGGSGPSVDGLLGNMQKRQSITLFISNATTYYWAVQTIDAARAKSVFSAEQTYPQAGPDTTRPTWDTQYQSANSVSQLSSVDLSVYGQDNTNLTYATLVTNETGVWKNITNGQYGSPLKLGANASRQAINFTWTNYTLEGGQNIGWAIMLNDSAGNTNTTFIKNFTLLATVSIKVNNTAMNFSELQPGQSNETRGKPGWNPLPFLLYNDGNFAANITIGAGNLFQKAVNPSRYFMFNSSENKTGTVRSATVELVQTYTNMPATANAIMIANMTNFTADKNQINVNINITIPTNEPPTGKLATITFTATQAY